MAAIRDLERINLESMLLQVKLICEDIIYCTRAKHQSWPTFEPSQGREDAIGMPMPARLESNSTTKCTTIIGFPERQLTHRDYERIAAEADEHLKGVGLSPDFPLQKRTRDIPLDQIIAWESQLRQCLQLHVIEMPAFGGRAVVAFQASDGVSVTYIDSSGVVAGTWLLTGQPPHPETASSSSNSEVEQ
jgi:hypothetical protein